MSFKTLVSLSAMKLEDLGYLGGFMWYVITVAIMHIICSYFQ